MAVNGLVAVLRAADAAARWHVDQCRKGAAQEPYVTHLRCDVSRRKLPPAPIPI